MSSRSSESPIPTTPNGRTLEPSPMDNGKEQPWKTIPTSCWSSGARPHASRPETACSPRTRGRPRNPSRCCTVSSTRRTTTIRKARPATGACTRPATPNGSRARDSRPARWRRNATTAAGSRTATSTCASTSRATGRARARNRPTGSSGSSATGSSTPPHGTRIWTATPSNGWRRPDASPNPSPNAGTTAVSDRPYPARRRP